MKIMIFIEGTTFYTKPVLFLFSKYGYKPIGNAVEVINSLHGKGHYIFLCSYVHRSRYNFIKSVIDFYGIDYTEILCRGKAEKYSDIVERIRPDVLIEDDCKSIGGVKNCCINDVREDIRANIKSIIVPEFSGIDGIIIEIDGGNND